MDVLALLGRLSGIANTSSCLGNGDVNHDGTVSIKDAIILLEYWAGLSAPPQ